MFAQLIIMNSLIYVFLNSYTNELVWPKNNLLIAQNIIFAHIGAKYYIILPISLKHVTIFTSFSFLGRF